MIQVRSTVCLFFMMVFCSCISIVCKGQNYYYFVNDVENSAGTRVAYKTLLTVEADGSATARIQYNAGPANELFLYQLTLSDSLVDGAPGDTRFLICNTVPVPLLNADPDGFLQPRFIFKRINDSAGYYYEPAGVEIKKDEGKWIATATSEQREKKYEDLRRDEPFVSSFYFESDPFYQYLFNDRTRSMVLPRREKMFLITVANTNDHTVGQSAAVDLENINTLFKNIAAKLGISNIIPLQISGHGYSKNAVLAALKALAAQKPSSADIIIFYYSGHGFRLPGDVSAYPNLSFRTEKNRQNKEVGDYLPLEEVYKKIMALHPKVCMVLGDCCNANIYQDPVFGPDVIRPKGGGTLGDFNVETATKLFLPALPLALLVGSVQKDHLSVGNKLLGGYFTHFFTAELEKNLWGYYSNSFSKFGGQANAAWLSIMVQARKNTYWKSLSKQCGATANDRCVQQAEIKINP